MSLLNFLLAIVEAFRNLPGAILACIGQTVSVVPFAVWPVAMVVAVLGGVAFSRIGSNR